MNKDILEKALITLEMLKDKHEEYWKINNDLKKLNPDFPPYIQNIDIAIEHTIINLLDEIIGDKIASYYLYEVPVMKDGGKCYENDVEYPIRTINDVRKYVNRSK